MKKILSKRSGFTLVEIIVAFAVFAIMAAMLTSLAGLAIQQRRYNNDLSSSIADQKSNLTRTQRQTTYSNNDGTFSFDFGADGTYTLDYTTVSAVDGASNADEGINYFVGNANYNKNISNNDVGSDSSGALVDKLDSRIFGSANFDYINIYGFEKIDDLSVVGATSGTLYKLQIAALDGAKALDDEMTLLARNFKVRFPDSVIDCGYITGSTYTSFRKATFGSDGTLSGGTQKYAVTLCSSDTIRFSIPDVTVGNYVSSEGGLNVLNYSFGDLSTIYILLDGDSNYDINIFGDNYTVNGGVYTFTSYIEDVYDEDGVQTGDHVTHLNIYGALANSMDHTPKNEETTD